MILLTFEEVMWFLVFYLIVLLVITIFLKLTLSFFSKAQHTNFGNVFLTAFLITITFALVFLFLEGWVAWLVALIVTWILICVSHNVGFLSAIVITVIAFLLYVLVVLLLSTLLNVTINIWPF
ncbi:MAG: hypothetical protein ACFFA7_12285 [Promethearchaeota archaeon]